MTARTRRSTLAAARGFATVHLAVTLTGMLLFTGLAVDAGRSYVVKAQLTKAVDGAALGAARNLNSGSPRNEAARIFKANFPPGYLGTSAGVDPTTASDFYSQATDETGVNTVTVRASVVLPTTFMKLGSFNEVTVSSMGEATRRMVDLSLVLDVSSSIGWRWGAVRDAARTFVKAFDQVNDRVSLITFGNGSNVLDPMSSSRGFDKSKVIADVPSSLPGGSTLMVEGLYHGWDELRTVPGGQQSSLRVIVLFTDGASNGVPGVYAPSPAVRSLRTYDFPKNYPDPDGQTWDNPRITGLYEPKSGAAGPSYSLTVTNWNDSTTIPDIPFMPSMSRHIYHRSAGIPTSFPLQDSSLRVNGSSQTAKRGLRHYDSAKGAYPAEVFNINNAARNILEIIANQARNDDGDYKIRIYTIGMGELVRYNLGTMPEKSEDILMRIANDTRSPDHDDDQLEGKYYFAAGPDDVGPAFQALQNQIIRLTK